MFCVLLIQVYKQRAWLVVQGCVVFLLCFEVGFFGIVEHNNCERKNMPYFIIHMKKLNMIIP